MTKQEDRLANWLNNHDYVDRYIGFNYLHITNLTAVIASMRRKGYDIETVPDKTESGIRFARWVKGEKWDARKTDVR